MEVRTVQRPQKTSTDGYPQRNRMEAERYAGVCSPVFTEVEQRGGISLIAVSYTHLTLPTMAVV